MVRLGALTKIKTGKLDANASSSDGEYPFFTCSVKPLRISSYSYDCECVLVAGNGDLNVKYYNGKFDAYQRTYIIESINKNVLFVPYLFRFLERYVVVLRTMTSGGVIQYIKLGNLTDAKIPLPPLEVQRKIAETLDAASELLAMRKNQLAELDKLIQSVFYDMFGDPVTNEKGWEVRKLGEICNKITDGKHGDCEDDYNSGFYFISAKDVNNGRINYETSRQITQKDFLDANKRTSLSNGDLIVVNTGATIGKTALISAEEVDKNTTFQKSVAIISVNTTYIYNTFLYRYIIINRDEIYKDASGSAQKNWLLSQMRNYKIILPPLSLQTQFAETVQKIEEQKALVQKAIDETQALFDSLMNEYFE